MAAGDLRPQVAVGVDALLAALREAGATVAVAESCTGGEVLAALTTPSGASSSIWGGAVVYANEAKQAILGLSEARLAADGPVAASTTLDLAEGVRRLAGTTLGAAVTGWAGPDHGNEPAGTVYLAVAGPQGTEERRMEFDGDRADVRLGATEALIGMLNAAARQLS